MPELTSTSSRPRTLVACRSLSREWRGMLVAAASSFVIASLRLVRSTIRVRVRVRVRVKARVRVRVRPPLCVEAAPLRFDGGRGEPAHLIGEMQRRCSGDKNGDTAEMQRRCSGDTAEMQRRSREM